MSEKHTVAMFIQGDDNRRIQVGWASPANADGVRTFEYSPGYEDTHPRDVSFEDDEYTQKVAQEQALSRRGDGTDGDEYAVKVESGPSDSNTLPANITPEPVVDLTAPTDVAPVNQPAPEESAGRVEDTPDEELAADPIDAGVSPEEPVELNTGGSITDVPAEEPVQEEPEFTPEEEAEFQRLLEDEQAADNASEQTEETPEQDLTVLTETEDEQPQTRRELRENEENS